VPATIVRRVVPDILDDGVVETPWLGISGRALNSDLATAMGLAADQRGVLVAEVIGDGPAAESDLRGSEEETTIDGFPALIGGDVIVAIDGRPVVDFDDLLTYIVNETGVGQTVTLGVLRDGETVEIAVTLGARPGENE
jgi:2-alkenal reductase